MKKRVVALLGSPHKTGSTVPMLDYAAKEAMGSGWEVTVIHLYEKQIGYYQDCRACMGTGTCVHHDDLQKVAGPIKSYDRVVPAAPTYWINTSTVIKNLFDRFPGTVTEETAAFPCPRLSLGRDYLLLTTCSAPYPSSRIFGQSRGAVRTMNEFFKTSGMEKLRTAAFAGAEGRSHLPASTQKRIIHTLR